MNEEHESSAGSRTASLVGYIARIVIAVAVVGVLVGYAMYVQTNEGEATVVTRFGKPMRVIDRPGPSLKWPWPVEQAHAIDTRLKVFNTPYTETITKDQRSVVLHTYIVWKVIDPLRFHESLGSPNNAEDKLGLMITNAKNREMGIYDLSNLVSTDLQTIKTAEIEEAILQSVQSRAEKDFGIHVEQVGVKRIAFPEENMSSVLAKMRANRQAVAQKIRAEGRKVADGIRSDALTKKEEELRTGVERAARIRGEALKQVSAIYREAFGLDQGREFYEFYRALEENKRMLGPGATIYMSTDHSFFPLFSDAQEEPSGQSAPPKGPPEEVSGGVTRK